MYVRSSCNIIQYRVVYNVAQFSTDERISGLDGLCLRGTANLHCLNSFSNARVRCDFVGRKKQLNNAEGRSAAVAAASQLGS